MLLRPLRRNARQLEERRSFKERFTRLANSAIHRREAAHREERESVLLEEESHEEPRLPKTHSTVDFGPTHTIDEGDEDASDAAPDASASAQNAWNSCKAAVACLGLANLKPFLIISIYSVIGAGIFIALEKDNDIMAKQAAMEERYVARETLIRRFHNLHIVSMIGDTDPTEFLFDAVRDFEDNIGFSIDASTTWDFWNALLYAGTIYTTIGYGNIACVTTSGRVATILYAFVGIPLVLSMLNDIGNILLKFIKKGSKALDLAWTRTFLRLHYIWHRRRLRRRRAALLSASTKSRMAVFDEAGDIYPKCPVTGADASLVDIEAELQKEELLQDHPYATSRHTLTSAESEMLTEAEEEKESSIDSIEDAQRSPPVLASVVVTFAWLFVLPAFFLLWEDWDYFTSFYFFFVSLSTIGFGDVSPEYPQYMIMNFGLVIVGLALVSVCINVVQQKIVDLYMSFLFSILDDYQKAKESGQNEMDASVGMMQMWQNNKKVKYLMPLLGKDKRKVVMAKFQEEAKAQGIEIPSILTNMDPDSGLPAAFDVKEDDMEEWKEDNKEAIEAASPTPDTTDVGVQAEPGMESFEAQTESTAALHSVLSQTSLSRLGLGEEREMQTHTSMFDIREAMSQTLMRELSSSLMQTSAASAFCLQEGASQTDLASQSQLSQTAASSFSLREDGSQTAIPSVGDAGGQAGASAFSARHSQSQTALAEVVASGDQAGSSLFSLREAASLAVIPGAEAESQAGASAWSLTDSATWATIEAAEVSLQQGHSSFTLAETGVTAAAEMGDSQLQAGHSFFGLRETASLICVAVGDSSLQAGPSAFDLAEAGVSAITPTGDRAAQAVPEFTDSASGVFVDASEAGSQIGVSTSELFDRGAHATPDMEDFELQSGASAFDLAEVGSSACVSMSAGSMQHGASLGQLSEAAVSAGVATEEASGQAGPAFFAQLFDRGAEAVEYMEDDEAQTMVSGFRQADFGSQTTLASSEWGSQAGASAWGLREAEVEAVVLAEETESQTQLSGLSSAEAGAQAAADSAPLASQTTASFFHLREEEAQTPTPELQDWASQAGSSSLMSLDAAGQTERSSSAGAKSQTESSFFARADQHSTTDLVVTGLRPFMRDEETQAGILSRVQHLSQRDKPSTSAPAPAFTLRKTGFNPGRQHSLVKSDDESSEEVVPPPVIKKPLTMAEKRAEADRKRLEKGWKIP